jgi:hypothetical protein
MMSEGKMGREEETGKEKDTLRSDEEVAAMKRPSLSMTAKPESFFSAITRKALIARSSALGV